MTRRWLVLSALAVVPLVGCSAVHDGYFANPCDEELVVRVLHARGAAPDEIRPGDVDIEATIAPNAVTKVDDAFQDSGGFEWFIEVEGSEPFLVTDETMPKWVVAIPATACP